MFSDSLKSNPHSPVPELLDKAFTETDLLLLKNKFYSGTTVVVAFLRFETRTIDGIEKKYKVLYTANVGDARAILGYSLYCVKNRRQGKALRLSYDHKGTDASECNRIKEKGGFVLNGRVNGNHFVFILGVLAVTRSLGDHSLKDWVIGNPFTTETVLTNEDEWIILACDGVSIVN